MTGTKTRSYVRNLAIADPPGIAKIALTSSVAHRFGPGLAAQSQCIRSLGVCAERLQPKGAANLSSAKRMFRPCTVAHVISEILHMVHAVAESH